MAVLKPAVGEAADVDLPPAADGGKRVGRGPAALFEAIQRERPAGGSGRDRGDGREFFDAEVLGPLLQLHPVIVGSVRRLAVLGRAAPPPG